MILSFFVVLVATVVVVVVVVIYFGFSAKMVVSDISQKYDVLLRKFKSLKHQNILVFTVWLIVPIVQNINGINYITIAFQFFHLSAH